MSQPHQDRVRAEAANVNDFLSNLAGNVDRLGKFLGGTVFAGLPTEEQDRLTRQHAAMAAVATALQVYVDILQERIAAF